MPNSPVAVYGLEVPCGDQMVPAVSDFPATFRITMAAIDPSEPANEEESAEGVPARATLKIIRQAQPMDDEDEEEYMRAMLAESDSEDEDDEDDEESANGGPSDPAKSKKARKAAAVAQLIASLGGGSDDEEMEDAPATNGKKAAKKGKSKVTDEDEEESEEDSDDDDDMEVEEFVLCTLDPVKNYQQPLDITINENEIVYFKVTGTHTVYLTGNYVVPDEDGHNHHHEVYDSEDDEEDEDYDLSPDEDELELDGDESDDLDALENPRITEVDSDDEEVPKLVSKKADKKGKNKRSADEIEESTSLDEVMAKALKPEAAEEPKLSKKQLKKIKKNNGEAAPAKVEEAKKEVTKDVTPAKGDKKVQFAKNLEQGPTGSAEKAKAPVADNKPSVRTVNGVKIEDKKVGTGAACKKGQKVGMRYIGKLTDGKVFDSNKKGPAFTFKLGAGEVIKGWDIGIAGMCVGGERRITVPANLAYGSSRTGDIPANSTLVFDVKMLSIK